MHGWLAKMRGTLIGNEELRSRGMREMKAACAERRRQAAKKRQHAAHTGKSLFSFLGFVKGSNSKQQHHRSGRPRGTAQGKRQDSQGARLVRPPLKPSGATHHSSHRSQRQGSHQSQQTRPSGQHRSSRR
ncbi:hypothetical protein CVT25_011023 [Psilocybe cyanescens]|uniref:Uncharacterized protein n=1 Tax=Psilocybe cyanescens TaxID=93625 RepID=A0A409WG41_PSICY|nr:hypothetical protein CVT25_011023 [Psilocybe cyanescens]